jgi:hypothetical protein
MDTFRCNKMKQKFISFREYHKITCGVVVLCVVSICAFHIWSKNMQLSYENTILRSLRHLTWEPRSHESWANHLAYFTDESEAPGPKSMCDVIIERVYLTSLACEKNASSSTQPNTAKFSLPLHFLPTVTNGSHPVVTLDRRTV